MALTLMLTSAPTAASAGGLPRDFFGVNLGASLSAADVKRMGQAGIAEIRFPISWAEIQSSSWRSYYWPAVDRQIRELAGGGVRALPVLTGTPVWVSDVPFDPPTATGRIREWSNFVHAVAQRYGRGGVFWSQNLDVPYLPVTHWQVWNEPNFPHYWGGRTVSARDYLDLLAATGVAIRSFDPRAKIVLAGLGPGLARPTQIPSWKFLAQLYRAGGKALFDVVADHPYAADGKGVADQLKRVASVMRTYDDDSPVWVTELGWASSIVPSSHVEVGPRRQAALLRRSFRFVIRHRRALSITRLIWFDFRDPRDTTYPPGCAKCFTFGLLRYDGSPKPAWRAFRRFAC